MSHSNRSIIGRWKDEPLEFTICNACDSGVLDDEFHFVFNCDCNIDIRTKYLTEIHTKTLDDVTEKQEIMLENISQISGNDVECTKRAYL